MIGRRQHADQIHAPPTDAVKALVVLFELTCGALFTFIIGSFGFRFVLHSTRPARAERPRSADVDRLHGDSGRQLLMCFRFRSGRGCVAIAPARCRTPTRATSRGRADPRGGSGRGRVKPDVAHAGGGVR